MRKLLLCAALLMAANLCAQDYNWQWSKRGGGTKNPSNSIPFGYDFNVEQIVDIAVDADNNYYFLAFLTLDHTEFDGTPVISYNSIPQNGSANDLLLIATDCAGTLRWTQTIGGGAEDFAYKIELDGNGALYLNTYVLNYAHFGPEYEPPHFSPTDFMPTAVDDFGQPQQAFKTNAVVKYDTSNGALLWRVMPQGDVTSLLRDSSVHQIIAHPDGTTSLLVGYRSGSHANGMAVVPDNFTLLCRYFIIKLDADGHFIATHDLHLEGYLINNHTDFRYDANLQRYYIAGFRTNGDIYSLSPVALNGVAFEQQAFIMAFDNSGNELWHKEVQSSTTLQDCRIYDLQVDSDSSLYFCGKYFVSFPLPEISFNGFQYPTNLFGNVAYAMKLDPAGNVQWIKIPSGYTTANGTFTGAHYFYQLAINGDEIGLAGQASNEIWDNVSINRPNNHMSDPALLRLDKHTGQAIALHDVLGPAGYNESFTAVRSDNDGNYILGGYFFNELFTAGNDDVATLHKVNDEAMNSDFFVAKLAKNPCGTGLGTIGFEHKAMQIYPNPATGSVTIAAETVPKSYEVSSLLGQKLLHGNFAPGQYTISLEGLGAGVYIINVNAGKGIISQKIIKQ